LQLLQPNARPPYPVLVHRIIKKSDQQASIFIQQKLKNASAEERSRIVSAIVEKGLEMMVSMPTSRHSSTHGGSNSKDVSEIGVCNVA
jgi:predicted flavoprotein YhiN